MCAGSAASSIPSRSFHSWHATSHALHPMQVVVSMSLATCGAWRTPVAGAGLAEMRLSSMLLGINPQIVFSFQFSVFSSLCNSDFEQRTENLKLKTENCFYTFSRLTRNALYSGVDEFGSSAVGVRVLASGPADPPANPQWIGKPICHIVRPSTLSAGIRLVTIALPLIEPRAELILTQSPFLILFSCASPSGISTKNSGCK